MGIIFNNIATSLLLMRGQITVYDDFTTSIHCLHNGLQTMYITFYPPLSTIGRISADILYGTESDFNRNLHSSILILKTFHEQNISHHIIRCMITYFLGACVSESMEVTMIICMQQ